MRLKNGENHLTQWDRHQILVFSEYPAGTEIHMWCDFFDNALKFELDGNREVVVPDSLLQVSGTLRVCVFVTNEYSTSYTEARYLIPVKARSRPEDYVYTPEETKLWEQKLDKYFGTENAGKLLSVGDDGNVTTVKGKDGISPLLRKSDTAIEVSYDGGATYTELVPLSELKLDIYDGTYNVTPQFGGEVILETKNKAMTDDVTVKKMPQYEVSNNAGGKTLILGDKYYGE